MYLVSTNTCQLSRSPGGSVVKNLPAKAGDTENTGSMPRSERSPGVGNGSPPQLSSLEDSMDRGA